MPSNDLAVQLRASSPPIPNSTIHRGPALWPARARACVSARQLRQTLGSVSRTHPEIVRATENEEELCQEDIRTGTEYSNDSDTSSSQAGLGENRRAESEWRRVDRQARTEPLERRSARWHPHAPHGNRKGQYGCDAYPDTEAPGSGADESGAPEADEDRHGHEKDEGKQCSWLSECWLQLPFAA